MNLQEAGDAPRLQHGLNERGEHRPDAELVDGGVVLLEAGFPPEGAEALRRRGHVVAENQSGYRFGGYQAIRRDPATGAYTGATESRKDGLAAGY